MDVTIDGEMFGRLERAILFAVSVGQAYPYGVGRLPGSNFACDNLLIDLQANERT
jgi:hypothetical protein